MTPKDQKQAYRIIQVLMDAQEVKMHPRAFKNQVAAYLAKSPFEQRLQIMQVMERTGHDMDWFHRMVATEVTKEILNEKPVKKKAETKKKAVKSKKGKKSNGK